jgi:hypothetical protein
MFKNLGRHLVLVYLPELYDTVQELVQTDGTSVTAAARQVLGLSFEELGVAVGKSWQLPQQVVSAMSPGELQDSELERNEDRVNALAGFSNELCDVVTRESAATRHRAVAKLLLKHRNLIGIDGDALAEILKQIESSLSERYAALLGTDLKSSRFIMNVSMPPGPGAHHDGAAPGGPAVGGFFAAPRRGREERVDPAKGLQPGVLATRLAEAKDGLERGQAPDLVLGLALKLVSEHWRVRGPLVLTAAPNRQHLVLRFGLRDDIEGLKRELKFALRGLGPRPHLFASAYNSGKDCLLKDTFEKESPELLPPSYYEVLGAAALGIYACLAKGVTPALLVIEADSARGLPTPARVAELAELRPLIARAAARA